MNAEKYLKQKEKDERLQNIGELIYKIFYGDRKMTKLKKCPFCGGETEIKVRYNMCRKPTCFEPHCNTYGCPGSVGFSYGSEEAIERWNTRAQEVE